MSIYLVYGTDVSVEGVLAKGNFDQMKTEIENISNVSKVYVSTKDSQSHPCLFNGDVHHLSSKLFSLPDNTVGKLVGSALFFLVGFVSIVRRLKEVDVVVSQGTIALQGGFAHLILKKPHVVFLHYFAYNEQFVLKRNLLGYLFRPMELFSIQQSNVVVAPNEKLKVEALAQGARRVQIIPNFVDLRKIDKIDSKDNLRKKLQFSRDSRIILFVGRLHPVKNVDLLLKAFSRLNKSKEYILVIVGDGPERQHLNDLASSLGINDLVRFEGFKPKETVLEFIKASDVLVLPSLVEGQPRVVLEAWACGLPVVASKVRGVDNLINDGVDGLLFPLSSVELFSEAITNALDGELASNLRLNGKKRVAEYSAENVLLSHQKIIERYLPRENIN